MPKVSRLRNHVKKPDVAIKCGELVTHLS